MAEKKTAIITGAASGLGLEFSKLLASDGYHLIMVDIDKAKLEAAKDDILNNFQVEIKTLFIDLSDKGSADLLYTQTKEYDPEIVINNAGFGLGGYFSETDWELEQKMINLHVYTPTRFCKLVLKDMISAGRGKIMNVASVAAFAPGPLMAIYYSTKAYLLSFGRAISNELKGTGVSMTTVCPGLVRTGFSGTRAKNAGVDAPAPGIMSDSAGRVAGIAYRAMIKGKTVSVPVFKNRLMNFLLWLLPVSLTIRIIRRSQNKFNMPKK
ncbi:MAG: SDR family oxidoreductase [Marinilabiliaceae bacterium]|jgi:short-subunit dehydrogenase|nr:SDR family oxidoreductase [Marinilabiliaceae bacterium]